MKDEYIFWFAARRKVWAWLTGHHDEISALWREIHRLEERLNEIYPPLKTNPMTTNPLEENQINCHCSNPTPTGQWEVKDQKSYAECTCGGWYETSLFKNTISEENQTIREVEEIREILFNFWKEYRTAQIQQGAFTERDDIIEKYVSVLHQKHLREKEEAVEKERERVEQFFKDAVPPHGLSLEDSVWLKRLLNKAFGHDKKDN